MPTTRKTATPAVVVDPPPVPLPGDEAPDPRVVDLMDSRTGALHGLLQPPPIVESDKNEPSTLPPGLFRPVPEPVGERFVWDPAGEWFLVCSTYYDRDIGGLRQSRKGDLVQLPVDDRLAQDLAAQYLVPAPVVAAEDPGDDVAAPPAEV
jgi:hypothetical protein